MAVGLSYTTISDLTNSTSYDGLLKKVYLPTLIDNAWNDPAFTGLIQADASIISGGGNHIVNTWLTQRAEGVGVIPEGGNYVKSVPVKGKQGTENVRDLNCYVELSGSVIDAANDSTKGMVDIVTKTFETNITAFKNNIDRMLLGKRDGELAYVSSIAGIASGYVTVKCQGYKPSMYLQPGMRVKAVTYNTAGLITRLISHTGHNYAVMQVEKIANESLANGTADVYLHVPEEDPSTTNIGTAGATDFVVGDVFIRESAYGDDDAAEEITANTTNQTNILEINGLQNLVSDGASSYTDTGTGRTLTESGATSNYLTCWGETRTSYSDLCSQLKNINAELDEDALLDCVLELRYGRQAQPNLLITSPKAKKKYWSNVHDNRRFNSLAPMEFVGGYQGMGITLDNATLMLTSIAACPQGMIFMINTNDFRFAQNRPMTWVLGDGGQVLVQSHTADKKFATAIQRMNFVCMNPYKQLKGYGVTE